MLKVRTVPSSVQLSGTTLVASPACTMVTLSTAASMGFTLRLTMVCSAVMTWQATTTGSTPRCGSAAWLPLPWMTILKMLAEAITGPLLAANVPAGRPGQLCMPNTASMGKRSKRPSATMACAPPRPSSAGWKIR
jgi:hypothetical protein